MSKDQQRERFLARIDDPDKNWKFNLADVEKRKFWKDYRKVNEACIGATSSADSPWHVVPADDKDNARLIVSQIVVDVLDGLRRAFRIPVADQVAQLQAIRAQLLADG